MLQLGRSYVPNYSHGDLDLSDLHYNRWNIESDNDIKLAITKRYVDHNTKNNTKYHYTPSQTDPDEKYIKYFDKTLTSLLKDEDEIIHRKDWARFDDFIGESLEVLNHPVFTKMQEYIRENVNKTSDILIVKTCGKRKPYSQSPSYKNITTLKGQIGIKGFYDGCVLSESGVIPIDCDNDYSHCYPYRYYDWEPDNTPSEIMPQVKEKMESYLRDYVIANNYKKVAIIATPNQELYLNICRDLQEKLPEVDFYFAYNDANLDKFANVIKDLMDSEAFENAKRGMVYRYAESHQVIIDIVKHFNGTNDIIEMFEEDQNARRRKRYVSRKRSEAKAASLDDEW